jgi:hypothetical protein
LAHDKLVMDIGMSQINLLQPGRLDQRLRRARTTGHL